MEIPIKQESSIGVKSQNLRSLAEKQVLLAILTLLLSLKARTILKRWLVRLNPSNHSEF